MKHWILIWLAWATLGVARTQAQGNPAGCIACPPLHQTVLGCPPVVPDFSTLDYTAPGCINAGPWTVTQSVPAGTPLVPGQPVVIIIHVCDAQGVCRDCDVIVTGERSPSCCNTQCTNVVHTLFSGMSNNVALPGGAFDTQFDTGGGLFSSPNPYVVSPTHPLWMPNGPNSQWVGPDANNYSPGASGVFIYTNRFHLACTNMAEICGRWSTDDGGAIWLNGAPTGVDINFGYAFTNWHPFSVSTGFVPGWNELVFFVTNSGGGSTGLRVELKVTACCQDCKVSIACPPDVLVANDAGQCGAVVNYLAPVVTGTCPPFSVVCSPPPGFFPVGNTPVICSVTDAAGNTSKCSFNVKVKDTEPPHVVCPHQLTLDVCDLPLLSVAAKDNCTPSSQISLTQSPPPGTVLSPGNHVVVVTACDAAGNCSSCSTLVTINAQSGGTYPIALFNTGVNGSGSPLPGSTIDPHYILTASADGTAPPPNAEVLSAVFNPWIPNSASLASEWIGPRPDVWFLSAPNGAYTYQQTFNLTGLNPYTAQIVGRWAADDQGSIYLNGGLVMGSFNVNGFANWTPFTISSGFVPGLNTLEFRTLNLGGGPTGIRVELAGKASSLCASNHCVRPPGNMTLWLTSDEMGGFTVTNSMGGNNGILYNGGVPATPGNGPIRIAGYVNRGLCYDGIDDKVVVPSYAAINPGFGDFSIDAWVLRQNSDTTVRIIADKRQWGTTAPIGYSLALSYGNLIFQMANGTTYSNWRDTGVVLPNDGRWHHVAVTVCRGDRSGGRFYLDGVAGGTFDPTPYATTSLSSAAPFMVASSAYPAGNSPWKGCIDEVEFFRRCLRADEIALLFSAQQAGKCRHSCRLPSTVVACASQTTVTVNATICNVSPVPQTYQYSFQGLAAGACGPIAGPTSFAPASGTVTVAAGSCASVPVVITIPPGMPFGQAGCYQMTVSPLGTLDQITCQGRLVRSHRLCVHPPIDILPIDVAQGNVVGPFLVHNDEANDITFTPHMVLTDDDGVELGTLDLPEITVPAGGDSEVNVGFALENYDPNRPLSITLQGDMDGDGTPDDLGAAMLVNVVLPDLEQDTDQDGIPDRWETQHGMNPKDPSDAASDVDHDGLTAWEEYVGASDPQVPCVGCRLVITGVVPEPVGLRLTFVAERGLGYVVEQSQTLDGPWQEVATVEASELGAGESGPVSVLVPGGTEPSSFYRIRRQ